MDKPQLTPEMIAEAARRFGVSEEEIVAEWNRIDAVYEQGGEDAVWSRLVRAISEAEREIAELVVTVRPFLADYHDDRTQGIAEFYREIVQGTEGQSLDTERLLQHLVLAVWKLAEAQEREAALLDGSRRIGEK